MTLTQRKYGIYAYRGMWRNGKVVNVYMGSGETALMVAAIDAEARAEQARERQAEQEREQAEQERYEALDQQLDALTTEARTKAHAALEAAGYYQHRRGEWRKRGRQRQRQRHASTGQA
jgi:hypothetical protein